MENENEIIDSSNDVVAEPESEATDTVEVDVAKLQETNKRLYARAKVAEARLKSIEPTPKAKLSTPKEDVEDIREQVKLLSLSEKKRSFGYKNNLSPEETDHVFRFAGGDDPQEALNHGFVKAGLEALRSQKRTQDAAPAPKGRAPKVDGKTWGEMKDDDRRKNFEKIASNFRK